MELGIFGNFNGTLIENGESVEVMETSTIEQFSEAEVLSFDIDGLPKDDVERKKLADFKYVNPDDLPTVTPGSFRSESKGMQFSNKKIQTPKVTCKLDKMPKLYSIAKFLEIPI